MIVRTARAPTYIEISALRSSISFIGRMLVSNRRRLLARARRRDRGRGMLPAVAITLVELGLEHTGNQTALNVDGPGC